MTDTTTTTFRLTKSGTLHTAVCRSGRGGAPVSEAAVPYLHREHWAGGFTPCRQCRPEPQSVTEFAQAIDAWDEARHAAAIAHAAAQNAEREAAEQAREAERRRSRQREAAEVDQVNGRVIQRIRDAVVDDLVVQAIFEDVVALMARYHVGDEPMPWEPGEAELLIRGGCTLSDFQTGIDAVIKAGSHRAGPIWGYIRNTALRRRVQLTADRREDR